MPPDNWQIVINDNLNYNLVSFLLVPVLRKLVIVVIVTYFPFSDTISDENQIIPYVWSDRTRKEYKLRYKKLGFIDTSRCILSIISAPNVIQIRKLGHFISWNFNQSAYIIKYLVLYKKFCQMLSSKSTITKYLKSTCTNMRWNTISR